MTTPARGPSQSLLIYSHPLRRKGQDKFCVSVPLIQSLHAYTIRGVKFSLFHLYTAGVDNDLCVFNMEEGERTVETEIMLIQESDEEEEDEGEDDDEDEEDVADDDDNKEEEEEEEEEEEVQEAFPSD